MAAGGSIYDLIKINLPRTVHVMTPPSIFYIVNIQPTSFIADAEAETRNPGEKGQVQRPPAAAG